MNKSRIYLSSPHMGGDELKLVQETFASNWIAPLGPQVDKFEEEFVEYLGGAPLLAAANPVFVPGSRLAETEAKPLLAARSTSSGPRAGRGAGSLRLQ